jgi:hypothetical protein
MKKLHLPAGLLLGMTQFLSPGTLSYAGNAFAATAVTAPISTAGVAISSTSSKTFITGTAQNDKIVVNLPLATKSISIDGIDGSDEVAFPIYAGPEKFQALVANGQVILWDEHATGAQMVIKNVAYLSFNQGQKLYQVACNSLIAVAEKSSSVMAPSCDALRISSGGGYTVRYEGSTGNDAINISLGTRQNIWVDGSSGINTLILPEYSYDKYYTWNVSNSVVTLYESHASGTRITVQNVKYIAFANGQMIYQVLPTELVLVSRYGQTVSQTNPNAPAQNNLR